VIRLPGISEHQTTTSQYEIALSQQGYTRIAGCDEAGRGPLAGPVVAAAVILPPQLLSTKFVDSKKLSTKKRQILFDELQESDAEIGVGIVSEEQIDRLNILQASLLAMKIACTNLPGGVPEYALVDGTFEIPFMVAQQALTKGETKSCSIAAASIVAKTTRDRLMAELHTRYPHFNFQQNQGYPTKEHLRAISEHGPCPVHRVTFKGVREHVR
jgi:ribonuclease HII